MTKTLAGPSGGETEAPTMARADRLATGHENQPRGRPGNFEPKRISRTVSRQANIYPNQHRMDSLTDSISRRDIATQCGDSKETTERHEM